jgi:hypothetical protein
MSADTTFADLEDRLRGDLPRLADSLLSNDAESDEEAGGEVSVPLDSRSTSRRRWFALAAAVATVALLLVAALVAVKADDPDDARPVDVGPAPTTGSWSYIAPSPLNPREAAVSVWTGTEDIIWGGRVGIQALLDGAAYNPSTDTWRTITPNSWGHPGSHAAWTGSEMVVLAKNGGAAYDPASDSWRDLPLRSGNGSFIAPVWTGDELLGIGVDSSIDDTEVRLSASSLADDGSTWEAGGSVPVSDNVFDALPDYSVVWTGTEAVVWDGVDHGWAYDPASRTWRALPQLESISAGVDRSVVTSVDGATYVVSLSSGPPPQIATAKLAADGWELIGATGVERADSPLSVVATDRSIAVFVAGDPPRLFDLATGTFEQLDPHPIGSAASNRAMVWTGSDIVVWGGIDPSGTPSVAGWRWRPTP